MANVSLVFNSDFKDHDNKLEVYKTDLNRIFIEIYDSTDEREFQFITLDKDTAIKLAKTLRTEINKIEE